MLSMHETDGRFVTGGDRGHDILSSKRRCKHTRDPSAKIDASQLNQQVHQLIKRSFRRRFGSRETEFGTETETVDLSASAFTKACE